MLKAVYFLKGYLHIRVSGASAERFINLCGIRHIMLWNIRQEEDSYTMCISLKSFFEIKDIVHKTSTRVVVLKRIGLPFLLPAIKKHWYFPALLLLVLLIFMLSQSLLWNIKIVGNTTLQTEKLQQFLDKREVKKGMLKKQIDTDLLEKELRKNFSEITWVSVYLEGNSLILHIKENDKPIPEEKTEEEKLHKEGFLEEDEGMDICAVKAGKVISIVTRTGTPQVAVGDTVEVGDVLIRGIVEIQDNEGNVRERVKVHADGDVVLESVIRTTLQTSATKIIREKTGRNKKYLYIRIKDRYRMFHLFAIPYADYEAVPYAHFRTGEKLGFILECGEMRILEEKRTEKEKKKKEYEEELTDMLEEYMTTLSKKGIQIKGKNVRIKKNADKIVLTGILKAQGPFFEGKETEIEEMLPETADE